jgi:hypothetical protein
VAVIGQSKKIKTLTLQLVVAVPLGMPGWPFNFGACILRNSLPYFLYCKF